MSFERLAMEAWDPDLKGTSANQFKKVMRGERTLQPVLIEAVARVLGVKPTEFPEYRLARTRELFDERVVGLDQAVENLEHIIGALRDAGLAPTEREAQQAAQDAQRSRTQPDAETRAAPAKRRGGRG